MQIQEHFQNAITDLSRNKLRTSLSMLWIIIGVVSVVVLLAIGNGTQKDIVNKIESLGTNLLTISPWARSWNARGGGSSSEDAVLDAWMVEYIEKNVSNIDTIAPSVNGRKQLIYGTFNTNATINGVTPAYLTIKNLTLQAGSFITDDDVTWLKKVAVLGQTLATDIFGSGTYAIDPIGKTLKMENVMVTVVGVLADNSSANDALFIPISTAQTRVLGVHNYSIISLSALDTTVVDQTKPIWNRH